MDYKLVIRNIIKPDPSQNWLAKVISESFFTGRKVEISWDDTGKPFLKKPKGYFISASDSGGYIAVAMARKPVGVDIELKKNRTSELLLATTNEKERLRLGVYAADAILAPRIAN